MLGTVVGAVVVAFVGGELDAIDEFDVGALVDLVGVAGGEIGDEKTDGAARFRRERLAIKAVDDQGTVGDGGEGDAGVKIVGRGMEAEVFGGRLGLDELQEAAEAHGIALTARYEAADVDDLMLGVNRGQVGKRQFAGLVYFA